MFVVRSLSLCVVRCLWFADGWLVGWWVGWSFDVCCLLFSCLLLIVVVCCKLCAVNCLLFVACCLWCAVCCSLFVVLCV